MTCSYMYIANFKKQKPPLFIFFDVHITMIHAEGKKNAEPKFKVYHMEKNKVKKGVEKQWVGKWGGKWVKKGEKFE